MMSATAGAQMLAVYTSEVIAIELSNRGQHRYNVRRNRVSRPVPRSEMGNRVPRAFDQRGPSLFGS